MNLFSFDQETSKVRIAYDFWIYIAICVPLTLFTVGYWFFHSRTIAHKKKRREFNLEYVPELEKA